MTITNRRTKVYPGNRKSFDEENAEFYFGLLVKILEGNLSDRSIDAFVLKRVKEFVALNDKSPVQVWNFYKEMLDMMVHFALASSFFVVLFDLEPYNIKPSGAGVYAQEDGSIENAPWRKDLR